MSSQMNLDQPPTDSVLRRHYEQLRAARAAPPAVPAARASTAARPAPAPAAAATTAPKAPAKGGVMAWLRSVFGG